jgi:hypothetical protein
MKNNIDFYQHYADADEHPKFKMLRVKFGWAGEGKFWALNNRIAQAENCCLDISKKYNRAAIASDLDFSMDELDEFLNCLLDDCELVKKCPDGNITTDIIQENFNRVMSDREKARERAARRWSKQNSASPEKKDISPEKVCKVKESKVNNNPPLPPPSGGNGYSKSFLDWYELYPEKKGKGAAYKSWQKIGKKGIVTPKELMAAIAAQVKANHFRGRDGQDYIPNPSTWLNQNRWEDEIKNKVVSSNTIPEIPENPYG